MPRDTVHSPEAPTPVGPYVHAVRAGDIVFLSGQVGIDPQTSKLVEGGITEQTEQVFANIEAILRAAGLSLRDVVKLTIFLIDMQDFASVNAVCAKKFDVPYPARSTVAVTALPLGARIEIEVVAR